ncbi:MAG: acylphosphatase, partial [Fidelibacterota bacterium]
MSVSHSHRKDDKLARSKIHINGIVQGVGFRPFIFKIAAESDIKGSVSNTSEGVEIDAEGLVENLAQFKKRIEEEAPPLAAIISIKEERLKPAGYKKFEIILSRKDVKRSTLISPDVCICSDCLRELFDPEDRRYLYPFINCTNCGPRYTIIKDIPYDRAFTSMSVFKMCPDCQSEYDDPHNRRFHAQPNACWSCGPLVTLMDNRRNRVECSDPIKKAAEFL